MSPKLFYTLAFVGTCVLWYVVIIPLYSGAGTVWSPETGVKELRVLDTQYSVALAQADSIVAQANQINSDYQTIPEDVKNGMSAMVPQSVDPIRLLSEVSSIVNISGLAPESLSYSEGGQADASGRGTYTIGFAVKGSYEQFKNMMRNFETSLRLYTIKTVGITPSGKSDGLSSFQVRLETYYIK